MAKVFIIELLPLKDIGLEDHKLSVLLNFKNNGFHISLKDKL